MTRHLTLSLVFLGTLALSCAGPMSPSLNRVSRAAVDVLGELTSETDSPYIEMAERFLRSGDLHSARDQLLRYMTMVKYDPDVLALIQFIESQIPPELPKMIDPPTSLREEAPLPTDEFGLPFPDAGVLDTSPNGAPILD